MLRDGVITVGGGLVDNIVDKTVNCCPFCNNDKLELKRDLSQLPTVYSISCSVCNTSVSMSFNRFWDDKKSVSEIVTEWNSMCERVSFNSSDLENYDEIADRLESLNQFIAGDEIDL